MFIKNIGRLVTMVPSKGREGLLGVIKNAFIEIKEGKIKRFGENFLIPPNPPLEKGGEGGFLDARGCVVIPGLIDCHTHLVHAGDRSDEFALRARGASYEDIAKAGGGIMSTVKATRAAGEDELLKLAAERAKEALSYGLTTIEVKSGYGLDLETEIKILRVVKKLGPLTKQDFIPTFLGAHAIPKDKERRKYIQEIIEEMLPAVAKEKLAVFCDVFVENIAFSAREAEQILKAAKGHGMGLKIHADQLSSNGGAALAAKLNAVSADHLENVTGEDIAAMAKKKVTAVLIPSSTFFVGGRYADARGMIKSGINVAISTDYNPGTSPILNIWLAANMAVTQLHMTMEEVYKGITVNAARAISIDATHGTVETGKHADLVLLNCKSESEPVYRPDKSFVDKVIKNGEVIYEKS
jgi:imidazolonepropionase